ncbi:heme peroxidase [Nowakowskiella sp. JEL0407]|nr:heme peroxidase [Nowakowskiella sp. JEL0407]
MTSNKSLYVYTLFVTATLLILPIPTKSAELNSTQWDEIRNNILFLIQKGVGPTCIRVAGHAALGYDKVTKSGGLQDFLRFHSATEFGADNDTKSMNQAFVRLKASTADISFSDLYSFCAAVAVSNSCGPEIIWRPGRIDPVFQGNNSETKKEDLILTLREKIRDNINPAKNDSSSNNGVSGFAGGVKYLRETYAAMGLPDKCIVALAGAHGLGRGRPGNSGYANRPRTYSELKFSNSFFTTLANIKWYPGNFTFNGKKQTQFFNFNKTLAMLPVDMAVAPISDTSAPKGAEIDSTFRNISLSYAMNKTLFFEDFKECFQNLLELGVSTLSTTSVPTRRTDNATLCSTLNETVVVTEAPGSIADGTIELALSVNDINTSGAVSMFGNRVLNVVLVGLILVFGF